MPRHVAQCASDNLHRPTRIHPTSALRLQRDHTIDARKLFLKLRPAKALRHITRNGVGTIHIRNHRHIIARARAPSLAGQTPETCDAPLQDKIPWADNPNKNDAPVRNLGTPNFANARAPPPQCRPSAKPIICPYFRTAPPSATASNAILCPAGIVTAVVNVSVAIGQFRAATSQFFLTRPRDRPHARATQLNPN